MKYAVVIATRNRFDLCRQAILSAVNQTIRPDRIVVVDDASDDDRYADLSKVHPLVEVVRLEQPARQATGHGYAVGYVRNAGLEKLAGYDGWLAFLDDDDEWMPHKTATQSEAVGLGGAVISSNAWNRCPAGDRQGLHHQLPHGTQAARGVRQVTQCLRFFNPVINSTALVRPDVAQALGHQQPAALWEDWEYYRRAASLGHIYMIEAPLAYYTRGNPKEYCL